jgi:hypothetical protein
MLNPTQVLLRVWFRIAVVVAILLSPVAGDAQTFRGTILGTVTDSQGASVGGAKVTVRNTNTGLERTTATSDDGSYSVPELPIGAYTVTIEKPGFQTVVASEIQVTVAAERRVDAVLKPGEVTQTVQVSGETLPQIETTSNVLGGTLTAKQITNLPVNGRDYTKLIYLNPGIAGSPDQITDSPGSFGVFSMNGARGRANNFLLDGTDMNDGYRNDPAINEAGVFGDPATILPIEAIAELRVLSNYEPEYGRNAGAVINIVTKSGTNAFHGAALEYFRNNWLDARNFFNTKGNPQNPFHNNQFGGSLGGPILKDRTFFFFDYEAARESGAQSSTACVPTPAQLAGATNTVVKALLLRNPWPVPNIPGKTADDTGCPNGNNLSAATPFRSRVDSVIAKVDHSITKNHLLSGRYYFGDSDQSFPLALVGGGLLPSFNTVTPTRVQLVSISYVAVLSTSQVNEARVGWNRFAEGFFPQDQQFNPSSIGLNTGVTNPFDFGLPKITVGGFAPLGADAGDPRQRVDSNWHFIDNYSWKIGRHDVKFGYEFRRTSISQLLDRNFRGKLSFQTSTDSTSPCFDLPALQAFLQGIACSGSQARGGTNRNTFENSHAWYVQDSFRWTSRFTLNFGVRWDYNGVVSEKQNLFFNYIPATKTQLQVGASGLARLYEPDYKNFAPRVSFAYDVTGKGKTVVRGGYGIFYDAPSQDFFIGHLPFNCTFCPGASYAGIGPAGTAISFGSADGTPLNSASPVYGGFSPLSDFFAVDRNIRTPYMQNFNLNLQQQLTSHMFFQVGYVGSNGHRLFRFRDINQPTQAAITAADLACNCINSFSVPRPDPNFGFINFEETAANSNYHALQTSLRVQNWHGLNSQVNYVWSHSIDDASDGEDFVPNQAQPNDSTRARLERGNSSFDIRHRFTWNYVYDFPKWTERMPKLTGGWGIDGVLTLQSGQPFHLNFNFEGDYDGSGGGFGRPDVVGPIRYNRGDPNNFLDLSAFAVPCTLVGGTADTDCMPGTRHFGNLGRNSLRGPDFRNFDLAVFKNTPITERVNLQLRFEFFNLANHPNFASPFLPAFIADVFAANLITATADVGIGNPFLGGGGPRGIQLAAKVTF